MCVCVLETFWVIAMSASPRRTYSLTTSDGCVCVRVNACARVCVRERERKSGSERGRGMFHTRVAPKFGPKL